MLLDLPPEIRLYIYEFALVEDKRIIITPRGPIQPSLLWVCSSVREEAILLYYTVNSFQLTVHDYNVQPILKPIDVYFKYCKRLTSTDGLGKRCAGDLEVCMLGPLNWKNLVQWCKGLKEGHGVSMKLDGGHPESPFPGVCHVLNYMIWAGMSWQDIERALEGCRWMLAAYDPRWAIDDAPT